MNICLVNGGFDRSLTSPEQLLGRYWHVPQLARALVEQGNNVTAIQAFHCNERLQRGEVTFEFVETTRRGSREWIEVSSFDDIASKLVSLQPDLVHVFGLTLRVLCRAAGRWCAEHGVGLTASFHGGHPSRNLIHRWRQRRALVRFSGFFFSTEFAAEQWINAGMLADSAQVTLVPEVSSPFAGIPKRAARKELGIDGSPILVWAGRMHPMKDPLTTLRGLLTVIRDWPEVKLLMAYQSEDMLTEVRSFLAANTALEKRVVLLGELEHSKMEVLFSAADFFVHSSRREYGSNALVEAMSCGAIPVVSDIPSLRALTEHIGPAVLFPAGDAAALARGLLNSRPQDMDRLTQKVKSAFNEHLSYRALAAKYSDVFKKLVDRQISGGRS